MSYTLGVDVGGTFTDLFLLSSDGAVETFKILSTPEDPSLGVLDGLRTIAETKGIDLRSIAGEITTIVHGTTVTTNTLLTRTGAATGLLTTRGVRDALQMRRGIREEPYNNRCENVVPLVPRHRRRTVGGRLDGKGEEIAPLNLDEVREAAEHLKEEGVSAVAICFMNAFANPAHERAAAEIVGQILPEAYLSVSTDVLPTIRFYNRVSTTVLNAYVGPVLGDYLGNLTSKLGEIGFKGTLLIMQSNGGVALPEVTARRAATTLLSGPAAGPKAAVAYTRIHDMDDCILVDMGGTSFDASLVQNGAAALNTEGEIDRLRIALPMLAITTIGAGGGSIGWVDEGGLLRMGPQSAGALPGPACYGRGGELPACTDADLVLGYLDPAYFAGGKMPLQPELARKAIEEHVARPLGLDVEEAAAGMYRVINSNMAHGVRETTVRRGLDAREFPMVVAGGAGALHACMIGRELEIPTLLVPQTASILCAVGMLLSDLQHDYVRSLVHPLADIEPGRLEGLVEEMAALGKEQLRREGIPEDRMSHQVALDLRYNKQYHEVTVPVPWEAATTRDLDVIPGAFHALHNRLYGYDLAEEGTGLELINVRVQSVGLTMKPELPTLTEGSEDAGHAIKGRRKVYIPEEGEFREAVVYDGHKLLGGNRISGPALIERTDTTIFVTPSYGAWIDSHGGCLLEATWGGRGDG